ncbi:MAG: hypothetical protein FWG90_11010 [Oscillospiraceae bacterium]|nr:hypothetical protein [Oscillospiraceae bacterium]
MRDRYIYIVLTKTKTAVAKIIRFISKKTYSHASLAFDEMLSDMYSFSRDYSRIPIPAHFNIENINTAVFGRYDNIPCEVYRIPVTEEQLVETQELIEHFLSNRKHYRYDLAALLLMGLNIPYQGKDKFVCSVWVGFVLGKSGIEHNIKKHPSLVEPEDLRNVSGAELIYEGNLKEYQDHISSKKDNSFTFLKEAIA